MRETLSCQHEETMNTKIELSHLGPAHIRRLHQAALDILDGTGVVVAHPVALELLKAAGARVEGQRVRIPSRMVEAALASAPKSIDIYDRLGRVVMRLGGRNSYFGTGSDLPSTIDPDTGEHRRSGKQDVARIARLCDGLENIDFCMSMAIASDASPVTSYVHQFDGMVRSTAKPLVFTADSATDMQDIFDLGAAVVGGAEELTARPRYVLYNEPISPLYHTPNGVDKLLFAAKHNIPMIYIGSPMAGATGPVTLSGCIAQASAESLSGLVIHQLGARGAPFVYGADASIFEMRSMTYAYGAPELQIMDVAFADLAHHYGLPLFCIGGASDSKTLDAQAGAEMAFSLVFSALNGCNLIHDVGYLESGLCSSNESVVLVDELIGYVKRILAAYQITPDDLALDVIDAVGPRGSFLEHEHTLTRYRQAAWRPNAFNRHTYEAWQAAGAEPITTPLRQRAMHILKDHRAPELSGRQVEAMDGILARRG